MKVICCPQPAENVTPHYGDICWCLCFSTCKKMLAIFFPMILPTLQ